MSPQEYTVEGRRIGTSCSPFVVAEVSGNHNGDLGRALEIIDMVAESGAHAVKFQTYTADTITINSKNPQFMIPEDHPLWGGANLYQLYQQAHTPWEWHEELFSHARSVGLLPFSSAFDTTAIELLESLDIPLYKVASLEIGDIPLLRRIARTGKPIILSNGAATVSDVDLAIRTIEAEGNSQIVLLACTSSYPASPAESHLRTIPVLRDAFGVQAGLSDHTKGIGAAVAAVALGATVVEKHVTLSRADGGVDSDFSLEPDELAALVTETQTAWQALGSPKLHLTRGESASLALRRSLYVVADAKAGDVVTEQNVRSIRPAGGLAPVHHDAVLGRTFSTDVAAGTPLSWDQL